MKYIRQIHVDGTGSTPAQISRIRYSYSVDGPLYEQKLADAVRSIETAGDYRLRDSRTGAERAVAVRMSSRGTKCIATTASDTERDSLLLLDKF